MPTLLMLYPAYGTVSCHEVCRHAGAIDGIKLILADDEPTTSDLDIFDEVWELPPPQNVVEAHERMRRWCAQTRPDGIFMQSERGLLLGALLAGELGLRGPSINAAHLCSNKYFQRVALAKAGIGNPQFALAENEADVRRLAADFGFPVMLKCVISTMSRLVTRVCSPDEIAPAVARMRETMPKSLDVARLLSFASAARVDLGCDPTRQFLVESFLAGDMVETDGLVIGDRPFNFGVTEQVQSTDPPFFIEGYLLPAECTEPAAVEAVSDATVKAIGLTDCAYSIEMRHHDHAVRIIEVNGRLGWDDGLSDLFRVRTGAERIVQAQQLALGLPLDPRRDDGRFAALAYWPCYYDGVVETLPTRAEMAAMSTDSVKMGLSTNRGARFVAPPNPEAYPHVAWALAEDPSSSHRAYETARACLERLDIDVRRL